MRSATTMLLLLLVQYYCNIKADSKVFQVAYQGEKICVSGPVSCSVSWGDCSRAHQAVRRLLNVLGE